MPGKAPSLKSLAKLHVLSDEKGSISVMATMKVRDYIKMTEVAFSSRGKIDGQRDTIDTTSATRIRKRMSEDFIKGAILPPIVVGVLLNKAALSRVDSWTNEKFRTAIGSSSSHNLSIIDGMQRTTVLTASEIPKDRDIRVEFWLSENTRSLTYRMLILNTGQIPWNLRRQIEVINASFIHELRSACVQADGRINIFGVDEKRRRANPGEYQANEVIEMYLAFGLRKPHVDKESVLADQFSRLDMIEAVSQENFFDTFIQIFIIMVELDHMFSRVIEVKGAFPGARFKSGRTIFDSQPACIGFMAAAAQQVYGRPGVNRQESQVAKELAKLTQGMSALLLLLKGMRLPELLKFIDFGTLNEVVDRPTGKIGDSDRALFTEAFRLLFESKEELDSMTPCWRVQ